MGNQKEHQLQLRLRRMERTLVDHERRTRKPERRDHMTQTLISAHSPNIKHLAGALRIQPGLGGGVTAYDRVVGPSNNWMTFGTGSAANTQYQGEAASHNDVWPYPRKGAYPATS